MQAREFCALLNAVKFHSLPFMVVSLKHLHTKYRYQNKWISWSICVGSLVEIILLCRLFHQFLRGLKKYLYFAVERLFWTRVFCSIF